MSTPHQPPTNDPNQVDVISNDEDGTITFVADRNEVGSPTEWITITSEDVANVTERR